MEIQMVLINCADCALPFAVSNDFCNQRRSDHKNFYCPRGHVNWYPQKSDEEKLRDELKRTQDDLKRKNQLHEQAVAEVKNYRDGELKQVEKFLESRFVGGVKTVSLAVIREKFNMKARYALSVLRRVNGFSVFRDESRRYHVQRAKKI